MKAAEKSRDERLRAAAIVKMKYQLTTGRMDPGFKTVYDGVLSDLDLGENEVDAYIEKHRNELEKICLQKG